MSSERIPFNWPHMTGKELQYISEAHVNGALAGDGPFTKRCHKWLEAQTHASRALLTHSCTGALEMSALLLDIKPGDEVIMPSFTFVSSANAFVLRGGVPVFVDIRPDTLNIDENLIEAAVTSRTKAIVPVHYAGVSCEMDSILATAAAHGVKVVEDAAQGLMASYKGRPLGTLGELGCLSFHETKNIISGEGGALLLRDQEMVEHAEIIREKGTDRSRFFSGKVDKYTWQDVGSSYLPGEMIAAFLWAQLEAAEAITADRVAAWQRYQSLFEPMAGELGIGLPSIPPECEANGHLYYIVLPKGVDRAKVIGKLDEHGINSVFHYIPLHSSPGGRRFGRVSGDLKVTEDAPARLIRLPLWFGIGEEKQVHVAEAVKTVLRQCRA